MPDRASALVETDITKLKNAPNITLEPEGNGVRIRGWGKSGHAATPQGTVNAIGLVVDYLLDNGLCNEAERAYLEALKKLHSSTAGEGIGVACADGPFGPLTVIGGRIFMRNGRFVQTLDSRYPTCTTGDRMAEQIRAAIGEGASLENVESAEPFYIGADTPAIKACIDTYNEVTGRTPPRSPWAAAPMPATSPMRSALARSTTTSSCLLSAARCTVPTSLLPSTSCWRP